MTNRQSAPIAVTDSGVGGLSTLKELCKLLPNENFIFYGDSANNPYGSKETEEVRRIVFENVDRLLKMGAKGVVIACNTATGAAVRALRAAYPDLPIVGIEPAIKPAALSCENPTVGVMATPLTLYQEKYRRLAEKYAANSRVIPIPCHGLADLIEAGHLADKAVYDYLDDLFAPYNLDKIDCVVLGCTHYALIMDTIADYLGDRVKIFDGGNGVARETRRQLAEKDLLNPSTEIGTVSVVNSKKSFEPILTVRTDADTVVDEILPAFFG